MTDSPTALPQAPPPAPAAEPPPQAIAERSRWVGLVWAVPLAALIVVGFLGVRALAHRGIDVVLVVDDATGAKVDDTKVIYQGVEGGEVTKIEIDEDGKRVDLHLRLDPHVKPYLNSNTKFWLVGAKPELSDLASVRAALAGLEIGVAPGLGGTPTTRFVAANQPPAVFPGTPGTSYVLSSAHLGSAKAGSALYYRGQEVGKVTAIALAAGTFRIDLFVYAPYDALVRRDTMFWVSSPLRVGVSDRGVTAALEHPGALLNGGIEMDLPDSGLSGAPAAANTAFDLYPTREEARDGPDGPGIAYRMEFGGAAGDLSTGTAVRLLGFRVGTVTSVKLAFDADAGTARTLVGAVLFPRRLQVAAPAVSPAAASSASSSSASSSALARQGADVAVRRLVAHGWRARLVQRPALVGSLVVSLEQVQNAPPAMWIAGDPPLIPSDKTAAGIEEMTGRVNDILAKVDRLPIEEIGQHARHAAAQLDALVSSPEVSQSLHHLDSSLDQVDAMLKEVRPQIGPLVAQLRQAADQVAEATAAARGMLNGEGGPRDASLPDAIRELTDAAQSIRSLADYLGRHPEALVEGKGKDR